MLVPIRIVLIVVIAGLVEVHAETSTLSYNHEAKDI
jgi:hypothetical protein